MSVSEMLRVRASGIRPKATPAPDSVVARDARRYYVEYYDAWGEMLGAEYVKLLKPFNLKEGKGFSSRPGAGEVINHYEDRTGEEASYIEVVSVPEFEGAA